MNHPPAAAPGPIAKLFALAVGTVLLVAGFMFSVVVLAGLAVIGLIAFGYFWWKTRALRKAMREAAPEHYRATNARPENGTVIDGEAVVVDHVQLIEQRISRTGQNPDRS